MFSIRIGILWLVTLVSVFWLPEFSYAQESHCDPSLEDLPDNPMGYRLRGDRCEGIYIKNVGSTTLTIASFTEWVEDKNFLSAEDVTIKWTMPLDWRVHLRAQSLKRRLYYRMDTIRGVGTAAYAWPTDILSALKIKTRDIGVTGWSTCVINGAEQSVYVPLRIGQKPKTMGSDCYQLVLFPGRELIEVFVSLSPLETSGNIGASLIDGKTLGYGYYPAERGIKIPICNFRTPGFYYLEIGATLRGGGTETVELLFYHPDR
ncbi:hypothetical protein DESC_700181 [Desulfosarcina cetonica]|uniref:hypothetical protein n=1 Tax=Desulfosarcina cetonica TaxID=90730 RepID=UPI0006CF7F5B|nr:hypothetical protein [Desulfosarcina cetonica]VTR68425.1 hypothetical protein DESC_700181 [Desulfosarcina cetonica]